MQKLEKAGMRISPTKSKFFKTKVSFLGFMVTTDGIRTCPEKVKAILEFETPKSLKSLRSFWLLQEICEGLRQNHQTINILTLR